MKNLKENKNCYSSEMQRDVLLNLITNPDIEELFFLTGGTALSVFYLYHRVSNDLDFFTLIFPKMSRDFDLQDFLKFYNNLVS